MELIALGKKKSQKPKIVVNLQHRNGAYPKIYWDILLVEILVLAFQMFALLHSVVFSLTFNEFLKLLSLWCDHNPKPLIFRWIFKLPGFAGMNQKAWNMEWEFQHQVNLDASLQASLLRKKSFHDWTLCFVSVSQGWDIRKTLVSQKFE